MVPSGAALGASGTAVTVRVEGLSRTLLAPKAVHTHAGSITKGGTPKGKCPATTAAGALDVATKHHWNGTWESTYGTVLLTSIFGRTYTLKSKDYWSVWVNDRYAQSGVCGLALHHGEQLLFAAVPDTFDPAKGGPLVLKAPASAHVGHPTNVIVDVDLSGKLERLAGARVTGLGVGATTNGHGIATIDPQHTGVLVLQATHGGDIRSAPTSVPVTG